MAGGVEGGSSRNIAAAIAIATTTTTATATATATATTATATTATATTATATTAVRAVRVLVFGGSADLSECCFARSVGPSMARVGAVRHPWHSPQHPDRTPRRAWRGGVVDSLAWRPLPRTDTHAFCRSDVSRERTAKPDISEIATYVAPTRSHSTKSLISCAITRRSSREALRPELNPDAGPQFPPARTRDPLNCTRRSRPGSRVIGSGSPVTMPRKVRAPQGTVPGNAWAAQADGKCNREQTAERSCRCGELVGREAFDQVPPHRRRRRQDAWQG